LTKEKMDLVCEVPCPHCGKSLLVIKKTVVLEEAVKAEREVNYYTSKVSQQKLGEEANRE